MLVIIRELKGNLSFYFHLFPPAPPPPPPPQQVTFLVPSREGVPFNPQHLSSDGHVSLLEFCLFLCQEVSITTTCIYIHFLCTHTACVYIHVHCTCIHIYPLFTFSFSMFLHLYLHVFHSAKFPFFMFPFLINFMFLFFHTPIPCSPSSQTCASTAPSTSPRARPVSKKIVSSQRPQRPMHLAATVAVSWPWAVRRKC